MSGYTTTMEMPNVTLSRPEFLEPLPKSPKSPPSTQIADTHAYSCASKYREIDSLYIQAHYLERLLNQITKNIGLSAADYVRYCDAENALELIYDRLYELGEIE